MSYLTRVQGALIAAAQYAGPLEGPMLRASFFMRPDWRPLLTAATRIVSTDPERAQKYSELVIERYPAFWRGHVVRGDAIANRQDRHVLMMTARLTGVMLTSDTYLSNLDQAWFRGETGADRLEMARRCEVQEEGYSAVALDIVSLGGRKAGPIGLKRLIKLEGPMALPLSSPIVADLDPCTVESLAHELWSRGAVGRAYRLLELSPNSSGSSAIRKRVTQDMAVLRGDLGLNLINTGTYESNRNTSFYLLHNSLPYKSSGYAIRSHGLIGGMKVHGQRMLPITRPGFPPLKSTFDQDPETPASDVVEDVVYHRLLGPVRYSPRADLQGFVDGYAASLDSLIHEYRPSLIHAASNWWNGLAGVTTARRYDIPSIYEVRGLWEVTRSSREDWASTDAYRVEIAYESMASNLADHVVVITEALKQVMIDRGIPERSITVVPNAVDADLFIPMSRDLEVESRLGLKGACVVGFVGSLTHYEGLDDLLRAGAMLRGFTSARVMYIFVGDGPAKTDLVQLSEELDLEPYVRFVGRVPHSEVRRYLSVIDISPFPRKPLPVTELVSPLKPLESMASGIVVLASDVAALKEMVPSGAGVLHKKGSLESLAEELGALIDDPIRRKELAVRGREWVVKNRTWSVVSERLVNVYGELTDR